MINSDAKASFNLKVLASLADVARPCSDGKTPTEIAHNMSTQLASVSRAIRQLKGNGMVKRVAVHDTFRNTNEETSSKNRYYAISAEGLVYLYGSIRSH